MPLRLSSCSLASDLLALVLLLAPTPGAAHDSQGPPAPDAFELRLTIPNPEPGAGSGFGAAVAGSERFLAVGSPAAQKVYVFDRVSGEILFTFANPNATPGDGFGAAVATSEDRLLVGAPGDDTAWTDAGAAYAFDLQTGSLLVQIRNPLDASQPSGDQFASAVGFAALGTYFVGAPGDDNAAGVDVGSAYLFNGFGLLSKTLASQSPSGPAAFGRAVIGLGIHPLVGDPERDLAFPEVGVAQVFQGNPFIPEFGSFLFQISNPFPAPLAHFGSAFAPVTPGVVVGAPGSPSQPTAGAAYVFRGSDGLYLRRLINPSAASNDEFGAALAGVGTHAVVAAPAADVGGATDAGTLHYYNTGNGVRLQTIDNPAPAAVDGFGRALAPRCNEVLVAAPGDDAAGTDAGAVYLYSPQLPTCDVTGDPSVIGQWGPLRSAPAIPIHTALVDTGRVVFWRGQTNPVKTYVWDPATELFEASGTTPGDMFCAGMTQLADGRLLVVGGHATFSLSNGIPDAYLFDPGAQAWTQMASMAYARWYPTATTLRDGRVLVTSGHISGGTNATIPEVFDVTTNTWTQLTGASQLMATYPFMFLLPDGRLFQAGAFNGTDGIGRTLDLASQTWTPVATSSYDQGSAAMVRPGEVLRAGGIGPGPDGNLGTGDDVVTAGAQLIDMNAPSPSWQNVASMHTQRHNLDLTLLPDGDALAVGGAMAGDTPRNAVRTAEIWDYGTQAWTQTACMEEPRMYHSTSVLLPDARVLVAGGNCYPAYQIYSPPYLFRGARPVISQAPEQIGWPSATYGYQSFQISTPDAATVQAVALMRAGSVTHGFDESQRYVPLAFTAGSGTLTVTPPANRNVAPPGTYLLFIVDGDGVPSIAKIVSVNGPDDCG